MIKQLLMICFIITPLPIDAMKRLCPYQYNRSPKKPCLEKKIYLPTEMHLVIMDKCTENQDKLRSVIANIKAYAMINKQCYALFNQQRVIDNFIEKLCKNFYCAHEVVARAFHSPYARKRLEIQKQLKNLYLEKVLYLPSKDYVKEFQNLLNQGVNFEFTYNYKGQPQNILMLCPRNSIQQLLSLLERKVDINQKTPQNKTILTLATQYPICYKYAKKIITHSDININQENHRGETVLLYCLKNRKTHGLTEIFIKTLKALLKNGANPEKPDNRGKTPLHAAYELKDPTRKKVVNLIKKFLPKKS